MEDKTLRKKFFEDVTFEDENAKKYLRKPIFHYGTLCGITRFKHLTNFITYAVKSEGKEININYPITLSGMSISDIKIVDAKNEVYNISLISQKVVYYEKHENEIDIIVAVHTMGVRKSQHYKKKIFYNVEESF